MDFLAIAIFVGLGSLPEWQGFRKVEEGQVPFAKEMQASVFRILHVESNSESKFEIVNTEKQKATKSTKVLDTDKRAWQIETCRRYGLKKCPLGDTIMTGTAFFTDPTTMYTCRHNVHNWSTVASRANGIPIEKIAAPIILFDYKGKTIHNSSYSHPKMYLDLINKSQRLNEVVDWRKIRKTRPRYHSYHALSDTVRAKFSKPMVDVPTLPIGEPEGERVFAFGYPVKTKFFGGVKKGDAAGRTLVATSGTFTFSTLLKTIFSKAYSYGGSSGGPMLNERGELVAVMCHGGKDNASGLTVKENDLQWVWKTLELVPLD